MSKWTSGSSARRVHTHGVALFAKSGSMGVVIRIPSESLLSALLDSEGIMSTQDDYLAAETRLLSEHGVSATSRFVQLPWRDLRTHIIEFGEGSPLIFVIGSGGFARLGCLTILGTATWHHAVSLCRVQTTAHDDL